LNLHDTCRIGLLKQAFSVHTGVPLLVQVQVLQSFRQLVPGLQEAVQKQ